MSDELKPCPFCGGKAALVSGGFGHAVECMNADCQMSGLPKDIRAEAITAWNRRAALNGGKQ